MEIDEGLYHVILYNFLISLISKALHDDERCNSFYIAKFKNYCTKRLLAFTQSKCTSEFRSNSKYL